MTPLLRSLRPHQWTKNLLVLAALVFAERLDDPGAWLRSLALFAAYCAASSAAYLVNDVRDAEHDRLHPVKRHRAIAAGTVSRRAALAAAAVLAVAALAVAVPLGPPTVGLLLAFGALQAAYTLALKHAVLLDVLAIAFLFVIRAAAGAAVIDVRLSTWLILCSGLLALFLALAKRRGELLLAGGEAAPGRPVLDGYSLALVDQLLAIVAATTIAAYALYTFEGVHSEAMMLTIPFVVFGIFRYLYLAHRYELGEEPERILLTDPQILATVALWIAVAVAILVLA